MSNAGSREVARALEPVANAIASTTRFVPWALSVLVVLYLASGIQVIQSHEAAIILRFGRVAGDDAQRVHGPGLLWAFPKPIDEVVRVDVRKLHELAITDLRLKPRLGMDAELLANETDIDPQEEGYCITGDQLIVQAELTCRYEVTDPVSYALEYEDPHRLIRDVVVGAMVRAAGEMSMDSLLTEERTDLVVEVKQRAQATIDRVGLGVQIAGLELTELLPPDQVILAYWDVQNAFTAYGIEIEKANFYRAQELPQAEADAYERVASAHMYSEGLTHLAAGEAAAFTALLEEYHRRPTVVKERLYREAIERALSNAGRRIFPPPPTGETYSGLRITIPARR